MKAFFVVCLAVAAMADSDPQLLLHPFAHHSAYVSPLTYALASPVEVKPVEYKKAEELNKEFKPEHVKVEAYKFGEEKKVEVPAIKYKTPVVTGYTAAAHLTPFGYAAAPVAYSFGKQEHIVPAAYHSKTGEVEHTVYKREAEAEADAFYYAHPYAYAAHPYAYAAHPYAYAAHPYVFGAPVKTYANDAVKPQDYASKGQYVAASAGAIHIAKREAEADAFIPYAGYAAYPYTTGYATYPYATGYTHSAYTYGAFPYNTALGYGHFY